MSCRAAENSGEGEGRYEVVLEDTVLFPEGGGQVSELNSRLSSRFYLPPLQPYDRGTVSEAIN